MLWDYFLSLIHTCLLISLWTESIHQLNSLCLFFDWLIFLFHRMLFPSIRWQHRLVTKLQHNWSRSASLGLLLLTCATWVISFLPIRLVHICALIKIYLCIWHFISRWVSGRYQLAFYIDWSSRELVIYSMLLPSFNNNEIFILWSLDGFWVGFLIHCPHNLKPLTKTTSRICELGPWLMAKKLINYFLLIRIGSKWFVLIVIPDFFYLTKMWLLNFALFFFSWVQYSRKAKSRRELHFLSAYQVV